jgi:hypothetical protein
MEDTTPNRVTQTVRDPGTGNLVETPEKFEEPKPLEQPKAEEAINANP